MSEMNAPIEKPRSKFANLALSQDFISEVSATRVITKVPVKRPHKQDWFKIHPDSAYRLETVGFIEHKEAEELYAVAPEIYGAVSDLAKPYSLYTAMTRSKVLFLLPIRLPDEDGKDHDAWKTLRAAMPIAMEKWAKIAFSKALGGYELSTVNPNVVIPDPEWPDKDLGDLLEIAFEGRYIDTVDHLLIKRMRGEA